MPDPARETLLASGINSDKFTVEVEDADLHNASRGLQYERKNDHNVVKWKRLTDLYNDYYLDLFNNDIGLHAGIGENVYEESQLGAAIWTGAEKSKLFHTLDRVGRHDVEVLATAVETKSPVEIRDFLLLLQEARNDRQLFSRNPKTVSQRDIKAAIEVDSDLEDRLEENADALSAFQDFYNYTEARSRNPDTWLVTSDLAATLNDVCEGQEQRHTPQSYGDIQQPLHHNVASSLELLKCDNLLQMSRSLFMNTAGNSDHGHWTDFAEPDEEPSITLDAVDDYYNIVRSLVSRIVQTAIFLAESRLRSCTTADYVPARILKDIDISSAVDVLNMKADWFRYWSEFVERSKLVVVMGGHRKGEASSPLTLEQVKSLLSVRGTRGRRASLSSIASAMSQHESDSDREDAPVKQADKIAAQTPVHNEQCSSGEELEERVSHSDTSDKSGAGFDFAGSRETGVSQRVSNRKRRRMVEDEEDAYMDRYDHVVSVHHCQELRSILGHPERTAEFESAVGRHPKRLRKLEPDLEDWSVIASPQARWEQDARIEECGSRPSVEDEEMARVR